ncbi:MAG: knotted carbamoyltransferase YgeW [Bacteroidetes bacterium]|nr:knotted carbamoyltransferase YgeW [Bacteroidota bacterium]MBL7103606.1 knotted carbamoyltransferase YgeW [Bacteroidales bacterium]
METKFKKLISETARLSSGLYQKDFLLTWEKSNDEIKQILLVAEILKYLRENNVSLRCFDSGLAVSIFRDQSTRTRFSYASAANLLGLKVQDMDESKSQIAHGETVRETANMISFFTEMIGIRDDKYQGIGNAYMKEVAEALDDGFRNGVLHQRPGIINLQCDIDHPTQSLSDLLHLKNYFGSLENLKGKKIAMTWAYSPSYGKPLSVPQGIIGLMTRFGMNVELAYPEGYNLKPEVIETTKNQAKETGGSFKISGSMEDAFKDADIVYPKSWAPYSVMQQRTELYRNNDEQGLIDLEKYALSLNLNYKNWECNDNLMKTTKDGSALYMHCLPADISGVSCEQGEVQKEVFEKYRILTYIEAGFKPYIIASMIINMLFKEPDKMLRDLQNRASVRKG